MTTETEGAATEPTLEETVAALEAQQNPTASDTQPAEDPGADADQTEAEDDEQPSGKPKQSVQERIDELTRARRDAEREAEFWRAKATEASPKPEETAQPKGDGKPDPTQYEFGVTDDHYIEDLAEWKAAQLIEKRLSERDAEQAMRTSVQTFHARAAQAFPDGESEGLKAYRTIREVPPVLQDIVLGTEDGPKVADYYGRNPAELQRLSALPPHMQAYEVGRVQAGLSRPAPAPTKTASDAPPPPAHTTRGAGGKFSVAADTDDFAAFEKAYKPN